jgi:hypothetical protein
VSGKYDPRIRKNRAPEGIFVVKILRVSPFPVMLTAFEIVIVGTSEKEGVVKSIDPVGPELYLVVYIIMK